MAHNKLMYFSTMMSYHGAWAFPENYLAAWLPWVWEYKKKQRKFPKKEREKEEKEGFPDLWVHFLLAKFSESYHKIYWLLYYFSMILLMVKNKTM